MEAKEDGHRQTRETNLDLFTLMPTLLSLNLTELAMEFQSGHMPSKFAPAARTPRSALCSYDLCFAHHLTASLQALQWALLAHPNIGFRISNGSNTHPMINRNLHDLIVGAFSRLAKLNIQRFDDLFFRLAEKDMEMPRLQELVLSKYTGYLEVGPLESFCRRHSNTLRVLSLRAKGFWAVGAGYEGMAREVLQALERIGNACSLDKACTKMKVPDTVNKGMSNLQLKGDTEDMEGLYQEYLPAT